MTSYKFAQKFESGLDDAQVLSYTGRLCQCLFVCVSITIWGILFKIKQY